MRKNWFCANSKAKLGIPFGILILFQVSSFSSFFFFPILSSYADGILHISGISQKCGKLKDFQSHHKFLFEVSFWHF